MELSVAAICDAAQVREGLLSVLSAGVNRVWRETYPAPMGVMLALLVEMTPGEAKTPHEIRIRVEDADGRDRLAEVLAAFQTTGISSLNDPGELLLMPLTVDFRNIQLPAPGRYQIVLDWMMEGTIPTVLAFRAGFPSDARPPVSPRSD